MVFSSSIFLFLFLPLYFGVYYLTPNRLRSYVILVGSYAFYAWWRLDFLLLFILVTVWNYWIAHAIDVARQGTLIGDWPKKYLIVGVVGNLCTLGYFKYANFGVDSLNMVLAGVGSSPLQMGHVILPIGISFYIFQAISYIVDVYRKDTEPTRRFIDFAAFIALFPQLIAGPVLRYKDLADQFYDRIHSKDKFVQGLQRFMIGFVKKVLIADSVAGLADAAFALSDPSGADVWLGILAYAVQLYFDFSGYSDMAIGLGLMMGFRFIENFNQPYISQSITEFWRRWHISLSTWLKDYLYIPLGGNRGSTFNTYRNLLLTMVLGGLWHGANWTFVMWGFWHGSLLAVERMTGWSKQVVGFNPVRWMVTILCILMGWLFFRADSITQAFSMLHTAIFGEMTFSVAYVKELTRFQLTLFAVGWGSVILSGYLSIRRAHVIEPSTQWQLRHWGRAITIGVVFSLSCLKLAADTYSPFLYFQF